MKDTDLGVLVIGRGAREHALYETFRANKRVRRVICAPGNGGIPQIDRSDQHETDFDSLQKLAREEHIDLIVVGPELPLERGIVDYFTDVDIPIFGPTKDAAELEWSKILGKEVCQAIGEKTANYKEASDFLTARSIIKMWRQRNVHHVDSGMVVKANGLCAGKGVTVAETKKDALKAAGEALVLRHFRDAGSRILIEERLIGSECTFMAICDGDYATLLPPSEDSKRAKDGGKGANTGGMGAYAPVLDIEQTSAEVHDIVLRVLAHMKKIGRPFRGVLYAGVMLTVDGLYILEFNTRFGDPEIQTVLPVIDPHFDIVEMMLRSLYPGGLRAYPPIIPAAKKAVCLALASPGYPAEGPGGRVITGIAEAEATGARVLHAGTREVGGYILTGGGRELNVIGVADTFAEARATAYNGAPKIRFGDMLPQFRTDIASSVAQHECFMNR